MALTVTVGGNDITAYVDCKSIVVEETGTELVATCSFKVRDHTGTVSIATKDAITITDGGTTLFAGEVAEVTMGQEGVAQTWTVRCQDNNILLDERVVASESYSAGQADSAIINDLFTKHRSDINSTTYVATIDASMEAVAFEALTLRECMDDICRRTGGRYYVDYDKNLHYFTTENNPAGFSLSTSPDYSTSFPFGSFKKVESVTRLANKVYVLGKEVSGWVQDDDSIAAYGERHAVSRDRRITTPQGVTNRGNAILDRYDLPRESYELHCWRDGLRAGMSITVVNETWGINSSFFIRKLRMEILDTAGEQRRYTLSLNDESPDPAKIARARDLQVATLEQAVVEVYDTTFDTDAPATPTFEVANLTTGVIEDADGHQIVWVQATWGEVSDADLDHYQIQISTSSDFSGYAITRDHPAGGNRVERFEGVVGNTIYYARVRSVDWVGNKSDWSTIRSITTSRDTTAPAQVANLNAAASRTLIGLNWTANAEADLKHYEIQRKKGAGGTYSTIAYAKLNFYIDQDFTDAEIAAGDTFYYQVRAIDTSDNAGSWSAEASAALTQIGTDHIAAASVTTPLLAAGAVTAEKISVSQLSAITADLGTITAGIVTGATLRTAESGARVQLDSTEGIRAFNSGGTLCFQVNVDGSGQIGASGGTTPPLTWNALGQFQKIQANQLEIGQSLFSESDGLLLLDMQRIVKESGTNYVIGTRKEKATLSGALHIEQGRWMGRQGLVIEEATTNKILNPSAAVDTTNTSTYNLTVTRDTSEHFVGSACYKIVHGAGDSWFMVHTDSVTGGATYAVQARVKGTTGENCDFRVYDGVTEFSIESVALTGGWDLLSGVVTVSAGATTLRAMFRSGTDTATQYIDAVQIEEKGYCTSYCDGDQGDGYAWTGTAHASTSTRDGTYLRLNDHVGLISGNDTLSFRAIVQALYDADADWPSLYGAVFDARGADNNNRIRLSYNDTTDTFEVYINGGTRLTSSTQTFKAGDWLDIVVTIDFANDTYALYVAGAKEDTDTTALSAPTLTVWVVGDNYQMTGTYAAWVFAEFAVFDRVLTAAEVAQLYNLHRPLVDMGATEKPGIYILDGQFRLQSSQTGNRIVIDPEEIAGYNSSDTRQFYLRASDGKAMCGNGAVYLDGNGITVVGSSSYENVRAYKFVDSSSSGNTLSALYGAMDADDNYALLRVLSQSSRGSHAMIEALAPAGEQGRCRVYAGSGTAYAYFDLSVNSGGGATHYAILGGPNCPGLRIQKSLYVGGVGTEADDNDIWCDGRISTDGGTTKWELGGYTAGAITTTGYLSVYINGTQYKLVCKQM